ncbi:MAG: MFS transporter [Chitinophagaceae bacterium]|nr:MFS transporter [Chitinophagaceae bacterium]
MNIFSFFKSTYTLYKQAYSGLSPDSWVLALVMLINRSGSMVVPFMSVYFKEKLGFGWFELTILMTLWGLGSMGGVLLGGWITDKIGHFWVQVYSLVLGGICLFLLAFPQNFYFLGGGVFITSIVLDCFRPANGVSVIAYVQKKEDITRTFSLNRMAINLGYTIAPILGGIISSYSFHWLFIIDGITSVIAGGYLFYYFRNKKSSPLPFKEETAPKRDMLSDVPFLVFLFCIVCFASIFFQIFTTLPLYYKEIYHLDESEIGLLIGLNGLIVFLFEMVLVQYIKNKTSLIFPILIGCLLNGISFLVLTLFEGRIILYISTVLISFAEIGAFPFMLTYITHYSDAKNRGMAMGFYSFAFSLAYILSPVVGNFIIAHYGFSLLWYISFFASIILVIGFKKSMKDI